VAAGDYLALIDADLTQDRREQWWVEEPLPVTEAVPLEIEAFLDFIMEKGGRSILELQRGMLGGGSLERWVREMAGYESDEAEEDMASDWYAFTQALLRRAQEVRPLPPDVSLPEQDLLLLCGDDERLDAYRYDTGQDEWDKILDLGFSYGLISPLADGSGFVAAGSLAADGEEPSVITVLHRWQEGTVTVFAENDDRYLVPLDSVDPNSAVREQRC
jgi:hypothetical protein